MSDYETDLNLLPKGDYIRIKVEHVTVKGDRNSSDNVTIKSNENFIDVRNVNEKDQSEIANISFINAKEYLKIKNKLGRQ